MLVTIPDVLTTEQVEHCRRSLLERGQWEDGRATAGHLAVRAKRNRQGGQRTRRGRARRIIRQNVKHRTCGFAPSPKLI